MGSSSFLTWPSMGLPPTWGRTSYKAGIDFPIRKSGIKVWREAPLSLICMIWKKRNIVVFEDYIFSPNRLKTSFISALISWARIIANVKCSIVRTLLCILKGFASFF